MRAWSSAGVGEDAVTMVVCLRVETTIFQLLGRLWKPRATETLLGALAWFAGIRRRKRRIVTVLKNLRRGSVLSSERYGDQQLRRRACPEFVADRAMFLMLLEVFLFL